MDPYALFNSVNSTYIHFHRLHQFDPHKLYKFTDIQSTNHASYGPGYMAFVTDHVGVKYKVQLPGKYLRQLTLPDHINVYLNDIQKKRNPFLVFRRQLADNSYVMEIKKFDNQLMQLFIKNLSVPEIPFLSEEVGNDTKTSVTTESEGDDDSAKDTSDNVTSISGKKRPQDFDDGNEKNTKKKGMKTA